MNIKSLYKKGHITTLPNGTTQANAAGAVMRQREARTRNMPFVDDDKGVGAVVEYVKGLHPVEQVSWAENNSLWMLNLLLHNAGDT